MYLGFQVQMKLKGYTPQFKGNIAVICSQPLFKEGRVQFTVIFELYLIKRYFNVSNMKSIQFTFVAIHVIHPLGL